MPQEVPSLMQDEHGDVMEDNEWIHESSRKCCKVNAYSNSYATKVMFRRHLDQTHGLQKQLSRSKHPSTNPRGFKRQDHTSMNVYILNNPHARQKWNEKKVFDRVLKKWNLSGMNFKPKHNKCKRYNSLCWYV